MTDSPYIKTYSLKQHTPMIHFQQDEEGATLRASEAKPKLDRFLIEQCKRNNTAIPKEWYLNPAEKDSKPALKYKMQIITNESHEPDEAAKDEKSHKPDETAKKEELNKKLYFGNIGIKENSPKYRKPLLSTDPLTLKIICFDEGLRSLIDANIKGFFLTHNFGARQTKGFGSFFIDEENEDPNSYMLEIMKKFYPLSFYRETPKDNNYKTQMELVGDLWEKLISKEFIKGLSEEQRKDDDSFYYSVRALLGVTEYYTFKPCKQDPELSSADTNKNSPDIQRFASPITFKILPGYIFILPGKIPKELLGVKFEYETEKKREGKRLVEGSIHTDGDFMLQKLLELLQELKNLKKLTGEYKK